MKNIPKDPRHGYTLIELLIVSSLVALVMGPLMHFVKDSLKGMVRLNVGVKNLSTLRHAGYVMEQDFFDLNEIKEASPTQLLFVMDSHRMVPPGPSENIFTWDADGDELTVPTSSSTAWMSGNDLDDDDDDNNGQIDVLCRYTVDDRTLTRQFQFNGNPWTSPEPLAVGVSSFLFSYYGSVAFNPELDVGNDCVPASGDVASGEGDGVISQAEIDCSTDSPSRMNGLIDSSAERNKITSVRVDMDIDRDNNGQVEDHVGVEFPSPLLPYKRKIQ